ncbi:MAG: T9SS C-terminal target domain-containing protein [Ignavibacteriae bacterium]|nr:MAG: T9SS C-terminal target domain-containing protein [Ignavibacteriota bacterium]
MKNTLYVLVLTAFTQLSLQSQDLQVKVYDPPIPYIGNIDAWGTDYVVSNTAPFGKPSGVERPNDTLYVAVPDSNIVPGAGMVILKSSNNGLNWSTAITISPSTTVFTKTKMVRSGLDTVYCFLQFSSNIYILRVNLPFANPLRPIFNGGYRDFDAWASSTGGLYVFLDSLGTNNIPRLASSNGGITWSQRASVTSSGAHPYVAKSGTGDTAMLLYYQMTAALADTTTAAITHARYRESAPGTLSSIAFLTGLIPAGGQKDQYGGALFGGAGWLMYTSGAPGSRNIMFVSSTNGGIGYGAETPLAENPNADEYNFDIQYFIPEPGGVHAIYIWDSTGGPSNATDKLMFTSAPVNAPGNFAAPIQVSEHPPVSDITRGYKPFLVEYYNAAGDAAAFWVGLDGSNRRLYMDRIGSPVGINPGQNGIPIVYSLSQNFPNPFNPSTKINFAIPKEGFVTVKIYDVLGREAAILLNKDLKAGYYTIDFNASSLSSGVYFYKMISGDFTDTKKLVLVR